MFAAGFITWLYLNAAFRLDGLNVISYLKNAKKSLVDYKKKVATPEE